MTADEFEAGYAARSGVTVEHLRLYRTVRPCACGEEGCEGWQSLSHASAADFDADMCLKKGSNEPRSDTSVPPVTS